MRKSLLPLVLLLLLASSARAATLVYGIVQDDAYQRVNGGHVWLERQWGQNWLIAPCCEKHPMEGHAFQFDVPQPGRYRVMYEKRGYEVDWIRYDEFTLPEEAPFGDIQIHVKAVAEPTPTATSIPIPTTLMPPTVNPTATPAPTANPAVTYIEISPHIQGALMAYTDIVIREFAPASCFEIAAVERGCSLAVTQAWVARIDGECWRFRPFSCPGGDGIELVARCKSPCEVAIIENGYW